MMNSIEGANETIRKLRKSLDYHSYLYYVSHAPVISDAEYDALYKELVKLEAAYPQLVVPESPTQRIGNDLSSSFVKVAHPKPILSLSNAFSKDDLTSWESRLESFIEKETINESGYIIQPKLDGLTLVLTYENGVLKHAVTRGNGEMGDDVTINARTIKTIPLKLLNDNTGFILNANIPSNIVVRGEVVIHKNDFNEIKDEVGAANARNLASGSLKQKDPKVAAQRRLQFYVYDIVSSDYLVLNHQLARLSLLRDLGFQVPDSEYANSMDEIINRLEEFKNKRDALPYETDGIVIKLSDTNHYDKAGYSGRDPRWATAYKFPSLEVITKLKDVEWTIGRTGKITPNAVLEPVNINGVVVSRASLHNYNLIHQKDIRKYDSVIIKRSGEVIPFVVGAVKELRNGNEQIISEPQYCPICNGALSLDGTDYYCTNNKCPEKMIRQLEFIAGKSGLDLPGIGIGIIRFLVNNKLVNGFEDLLSFDPIKLLDFEGFGDKKVEAYREAVAEVATRPFWMTLMILGIDGVGHTTSKTLVKKYSNWNSFKKADLEGLLGVDGIGYMTASSILIWLNDQANLDMVDRLGNLGVNLGDDSPPNPDQINSLVLDGKTFAITGALSKPRDYFIKIIEQNGGSVSGGVSRKTNYLIAGDSAGSKIDQARKLGVTVLDEAEFIKMLS